MQKKIDLSWTKNLYEVGSAIRSSARSIQFRIEDAADRLEEAKKAHRQVLQQIRKDAKQLEDSVVEHWSAKEIDAAKRGFLLVDGKEIKA